MTSLSAPARVLRPAGLLLAVLTLLLPLLGVTLGAPPAHAHDTLVSSDPEDGALLEQVPEQITLTFSDAPLEVSPRVVVTAEDGSVVADGEPRIDGTDAILDLPDGMTPGAYDVSWRVASSDGHPIEGEFGFDVAAEAQVGPGGASDDGGSSDAGGATTEAASDAGGESATDRPEDAGDENRGAGPGTGVLIGGVLLLAALAVGAGLLIARRSRG